MSINFDYIKENCETVGDLQQLHNDFVSIESKGGDE